MAITALLTACVVATVQGDAPKVVAPKIVANQQNVEAAIKKGVAYLRGAQEKDGSFGAPRNITYYEYFAAPTYDAWGAATTSLSAMALLDCGESEEDGRALDRAVDWLLKNVHVKRVSDWDTDNVWAYVYGLHAFAHLLPAPRFAKDPRRPAMIEAGDKLIATLERWQTPLGGWSYYDFDATTIPPAWTTSFTTAATVIALLDAKAAGLTVKDAVLNKALDCVKHARLPTGAYTYNVSPITEMRGLEMIDNVKGSLSRIQVGNVALCRAGRLDLKVVAEGLDLFFEHHRFLDCGRKRPIPHEAYYQVAAYFFLFGHFYASQAIELLPPEQRTKYAPRLQRVLLDIQEPDGATWDMFLADFTRCYGTAYSIMSLQRTLGPRKTGT